jgi:5'-nucleotidase
MHFVRSRHLGTLLAAALGVSLAAGLAAAPANAAAADRTVPALATSAAGQYSLKPSTLYLGPSVFSAKTTLSLSTIPAEVTEVRVAWGDLSEETVDPTAGRIPHEYNLKGDHVVSVVEVTAAGESAPLTVGTVHVKNDASKPKVSITKPKKPKKVASWRTVKGKITDKGAGLQATFIILIQARGTKVFYYNGKRWLRFTSSTDPGKAVLKLKLKKNGTYAYKVKGLKKGHLALRVLGHDKVGNFATASRSPNLTR